MNFRNTFFYLLEFSVVAILVYVMMIMGIHPRAIVMDSTDHVTTLTHPHTNLSSIRVLANNLLPQSHPHSQLKNCAVILNLLQTHGNQSKIDQGNQPAMHQGNQSEMHPTMHLMGDVTGCYFEKSLSEFSRELYSKTLAVMQSHDCSSSRNGNGTYLIHRSPHTVQGGTVLCTSMYHSVHKQYVFMNTIINWSSSLTHIQPVLYITDRSLVDKSGILVYLAYIAGWTIAVADSCLKSGYPLLPTMLRNSWTYVPEATWYGYANADLLFTRDFLNTMTYVESYNSQHKGEEFTFITSRRRNTVLDKGHILSSLDAVDTLAKSAKLHSVIAIDIFLYRSQCSAVQDMLPLATGRRGYDQYLIYDVLKRGYKSLDITSTNRMLHIGVAGLTFDQNSHRSRKEDADYNMNVIKNKRIYGWLPYGQTDCVPYTTVYVNTTNINIVQRQKRTLCKSMSRKPFPVITNATSLVNKV